MSTLCRGRRQQCGNQRCQVCNSVCKCVFMKTQCVFDNVFSVISKVFSYFPLIYLPRYVPLENISARPPIYVLFSKYEDSFVFQHKSIVQNWARHNLNDFVLFLCLSRMPKPARPRLRRRFSHVSLHKPHVTLP